MGKIRHQRRPRQNRLKRYRDKRSAERTPEPVGAGPPDNRAGPLQFVVQQHAARRMHWDLRLEMDGVLRSWAVPKGPSLDPEQRRLAVLTEDHPLEYAEFEGIIPAGNYGAGAMILWDRGTWTPVEPADRGFEAGKLLFDLHGHKLRGRWTLVRTKGEHGKQWLLIKKPDRAATTGRPPFGDESILSGLTVEQLEAGIDRSETLRDELEALDCPAASRAPWQLEPMLAAAADGPFTAKEWLFELKYDGYRMLAGRSGADVWLHFRSGNEATAAFPDLARALRALPYESFVLDGEVVVLDEDGHPNFQRLQKRTKQVRTLEVERAMLEHPATLYAFDLLQAEGSDTRKLPLHRRKQILQRMLPGTGTIRFADHILERGEDLYREVVDRGLEGIMAKRVDSPYVTGRSRHWLKIRADRTDDFVIVGFTAPRGSRTGLGALHLATYHGQELHYAGRVGTGFGESQLAELHQRLQPLLREQPPCTGAVPSGLRHHWVKPELVCEVRYREITNEGLLRQPVFLRMREDKFPDECIAHVGEPPSELLPQDAPVPDGSPHPAVTVSNPDKVFWPEDGYTKLDLVEFYRAVGPWLLPYLRDRPLVLTRYPDGIRGKSFFQKNAPSHVPPWIRTETIWSEHSGREIDYFICDELEAIAYVANLGAIPLHVWGSRIERLQSPDWCILDLDPKGAPFQHVVRIARVIHELCEQVELPSFVKTSGATGLHVLLPLTGQCNYEQARMLGQILARVIVERLPNIATVDRSLDRRAGRVYIDYLQNGHGRLLVAPLSVRPLPGAPVSTPLRWDEVEPNLDPARFTMTTVPDRLRHMEEDPMVPVLEAEVDLPEVLERLAERMR